MSETTVSCSRTESDMIGTHMIAANMARDRLMAAFAMWCAMRELDPRTELVAVQTDHIVVRAPDSQADGSS